MKNANSVHNVDDFEHKLPTPLKTTELKLNVAQNSSKILPKFETTEEKKVQMQKDSCRNYTVALIRQVCASNNDNYFDKYMYFAHC